MSAVKSLVMPWLKARRRKRAEKHVAELEKEYDVLREAARTGRPVWQILGEPDPKAAPVETAVEEKPRKDRPLLRLLGNVLLILGGAVVWCTAVAIWIGGGGLIFGLVIKEYTWPVVKWFGVNEGKWGNMCWALGGVISLLVGLALDRLLKKIGRLCGQLREAYNAWAIAKGWKDAPEETDATEPSCKEDDEPKQAA